MVASFIEREAGRVVMGLVFALFGMCFALWVDRSTGINMVWTALGWVGRSMGAVSRPDSK